MGAELKQRTYRRTVTSCLAQSVRNVASLAAPAANSGHRRPSAEPPTDNSGQQAGYVSARYARPAANNTTSKPTDRPTDYFNIQSPPINAAINQRRAEHQQQLQQSTRVFQLSSQPARHDTTEVQFTACILHFRLHVCCNVALKSQLK